MLNLIWDKMKVRFHCFVSGIVQGVSFRSYTYKNAEKFGLTGWVKNLPDGRVEILVEGINTKIEEFLDALKTGPSMSHVDRIDIEKEKYRGSFADFRIVL